MDDISQFQDLFLETARDHISKLKSLIVKNKADNSKELIEEMHLHLHSLKGEALVMHHVIFGRYITILESYVKNIRDANSQISQDKLQIIDDAIREASLVLDFIKIEKKEPLDLDTKSNILSVNLGTNV